MQYSHNLSGSVMKIHEKAAQLSATAQPYFYRKIIDMRQKVSIAIESDALEFNPEKPFDGY